LCILHIRASASVAWNPAPTITRTGGAVGLTGWNNGSLPGGNNQISTDGGTVATNQAAQYINCTLSSCVQGGVVSINWSAGTTLAGATITSAELHVCSWPSTLSY